MTIKHSQITSGLSVLIQSYDSTIIYLDRFDNLWVSGTLLKWELQSMIGSTTRIVNPPYKWLYNIKDARIWLNNLMILTTQSKLYTFGEDFNHKWQRFKLKPHATNVKSIGGPTLNNVGYLYYITNNNELHGFFRQERYISNYNEPTSDQLIATNVNETAVEIRANSGFAISYKIWYTNFEYQLFLSNATTGTLLLSNVKTFDIMRYYGSAIVYIGLDGKIYIYQHNMTNLLLAGQYKTLKLTALKLHIIDNNLNLWFTYFREDPSNSKNFVLAIDLKLLATTVLNFSYNSFEPSYVQLSP